MRTLIIAVFTGVLAFPGSLNAQEAVSLADGGKVYSQSCGRCHNPRAPNERSDREWDVIVAHMRTRANLSGRETRAVLLFLQAVNGINGDGGGDAAGGADPESMARGLEDSPSASFDVAGVARGRGPNVQRPALFLPSQDNALVDEGRKLMEAKACIACHSIGKHSSGVLGPNLNTVLSRRSEEYLMQKLADPKVDNPTSVMPQMDLTKQEREALLAYIKSVAKR